MEIIKFGGYDWCVLDRKDGKILLISKDLVEKRAYHTTQTVITWADCDLRAYLNDDFYNKFSEIEKAKIITTTNKNSVNSGNRSKGGTDTQDNIFLLSFDEAKQYFKNDGERTAKEWWWLRSPGGSTDGNSEMAARVYSSGYVDAMGVYVEIDGNNEFGGGGVRPALWLIDE